MDSDLYELFIDAREDMNELREYIRNLAADARQIQPDPDPDPDE